MYKFFLILLFFTTLAYSARVYSANDSLYFFTSNTLFAPTETSIIESKIGVTKYTDDDNLKLDIGVSIDLLGLKRKTITYSFGVDFFTFSNLRSESNFKFPVDAIDYMFGINFNFKKHLSKKTDLAGRFRISHISSHLEDGHKYERTDTVFTPYVFSKEFLDFAVVSDYNAAKNLFLKGLLSLNIIFHSIPDEISPVSGQAGFQVRYFLAEILSCYISDNIELASVNSETDFNNNFETGISLGMTGTRSLNFYFTYYVGQDYRGQYYGNYLNNTGLGLRFKF